MILKRLSNIYPKVYSMDNLKEAHKNARKDKLFYRDVKMVDANEEYYLTIIQKMLKYKNYHVSNYIHKTINDRGKEREIDKLPYFPDRIIQWAIMLQLEDMFEKHFIYTSFASRKGKGITAAHETLNKYLKDVENTQYCLRVDVKHFYPSINKEILKQMLRKQIKDKDMLWILDITIDSLNRDQEAGLPIGAYLSQYLANFYLSEFDHWIKEQCHIKYYLRYMDDIIILGADKKELQDLKRKIEIYLWENLKLELNNKKQVFPVDIRGVDFVGFRHYHNYTLLRKKTCKYMKRSMLNVKRKIQKGKELNYTNFCMCNSYRGWMKHCNSRRLYNEYLKPLEKDLNKYYYKYIYPNTKKGKKYENSRKGSRR